ncbi:Metallo-dependent hydrolase [Microthyrium microscopicum]|uniref:Metallo-dependent hydrolase n=1 Tax=Microthyrium microscopicum TaxID=703497 RepID=A0A6A6UEF2_9PEZI|nr:Metallo-dependent hydrolase [Microthyrium microscopicum]
MQPSQKSFSRISSVRLPSRPTDTLWDISIEDGKIAGITEQDDSIPTSDDSVYQADGGLLAPSLCHAHIHLDKCFLLQDPAFGDLQIKEGSFQEAMELTTAAKTRFTSEDLLRRGRRLIEESIGYGVTSMRAFVELDGDVMSRCLEAAIKLKDEYASLCDIQICAFAQNPIISGDGAETVQRLMTEAAANPEVDVVGSTPYVEDDENLEKHLYWIIDLALRNKKRLDFHLDYFVNEKRQPSIWRVIELLRQQKWPLDSQVLLGHCTRLVLFPDEEWQKLHNAIGDLPITFVGLPTSDLFMMRTDSHIRGTLDIPKMIKKHNLDGILAVNNVGNAFTPQGNCDPLSIASLGVALFHAGTKDNCELLYHCVSTRAKSAIGFINAPYTDRELAVGQPADFLLFEYDGGRTRKTITEAVLDGGTHRRTFKNGTLIYLE